MNLLEKIAKATADIPTDEAPAKVEKCSVGSLDELPENVKASLPTEAQQIWMRAYNWSYVDEDLNEARAIEEAWSEIRWAGYQKIEDGSYVIVKRDASHDMSQRVVKHAEDRRYTLGVVYEPGVPDTEGDQASAEEIEKAAHGFMRILQSGPAISKRQAEFMTALAKAVQGEEVQLDVTDLLEGIEKGAGLNDMHVSTDADHELGDVVECFVAPCDMTVSGQEIKKGSWCLGVVWSEAHWPLIKSGERTGYSMEGLGVRVPVVVEE